MKTYWQNTTTNMRLWITILGCSLIYLAFTAPFELRHYFSVSPPVDYAKLTRYSPVGFAAYLIGIAALFGFYLLGLRTLVQDHENNQQGENLRYVLLGSSLFALILLFSYPQTAIDMLVYAIRTRGWALYELSPFAAPPDAFPASDPWLSLAGEWADAASPYGPVWEWLSLGAYYLSGGFYLGHLFAIKILSALTYLGSVWLVYRILRQFKPEWAVPGTAFFAWNPLVLFESVQNAHNDIIMVFFLLAAVWAYILWVQQPKIWLGLIFVTAFVLSILVKFITLLVLPFFLFGMALRQSGWARRLSIIFLFSLAILLLSAALMALYWPGLENWAVMRSGQGAGRSVTALLVLILLRYTGSTSAAFDIANRLIYLIFGGIYLWGLWRVTCLGNKCFQGPATTLSATREQPLKVSFYIFFWYALFVATVFHAWYLLWFMPLAAAMVPNRRIMSGAFVFSLMALLIIPYYETIRVWLPFLNQNHLLGHAIGVPLILIPTLLSLWKPLRLVQNRKSA